MTITNNSINICHFLDCTIIRKADHGRGSFTTRAGECKVCIVSAHLPVSTLGFDNYPAVWYSKNHNSWTLVSRLNQLWTLKTHRLEHQHQERHGLLLGFPDYSNNSNLMYLTLRIFYYYGGKITTRPLGIDHQLTVISSLSFELRGLQKAIIYILADKVWSCLPRSIYETRSPWIFLIKQSTMLANLLPHLIQQRGV